MVLFFIFNIFFLPVFCLFGLHRCRRRCRHTVNSFAFPFWFFIFIFHFPFYLGAFAALWQTSVHLFAKFNVSPFCQDFAIPFPSAPCSLAPRWWQIILLRFLGDSIHPSGCSARPKLPISMPPSRTGQLWLEFNKNGLMGNIFCSCHAPGNDAPLHSNKREIKINPPPAMMNLFRYIIFIKIWYV